MLPGYRTDHFLMLLSLEFGNFKRVYHSGYLIILCFYIYVNKVKSVILETKLQNATNILESNNINDIPLSDLRFNIDDQLLSE